MTYSEPARTTTRRIRIRRIRVAGLLVVIAAIAAALGYQLLASSSSTAASPIDVLRSEHRGALGEALPSTVWPADGQAAFVQGGQSQIQAGPNQHAAAIASVAKVMTAYLVLRDHPLRLGEDGPTITLTDADVADTDRRRGQRGVGRVHRRRRAVDRTAGAAGTAAAVGEQHRRGSGAMGRRLGGPVRCPDECHRTVAGHDPHPLHRPERLRRRNRVDCRRPGAHRRSGHAPAGVREHRRHTERDAAGRRHRAQHQHIARAQRVRRRQDRLGRRGRRLLRLPGHPLDRRQADDDHRGRVGPARPRPDRGGSRGRRRHGRPHRRSSGYAEIYGNEPWHRELRPEVIDRGWTLGREPVSTRSGERKLHKRRSSAVDDGHVSLFVALACGRGEVVKPFDLFRAQLETVGGCVLFDAGHALGAGDRGDVVALCE